MRVNKRKEQKTTLIDDIEDFLNQLSSTDLNKTEGEEERRTNSREKIKYSRESSSSSLSADE